MRLIKISTVIVFAFFMVMSCDKVKNPIPVKQTAVGTNFITKTNESKVNFRKVFLEDYTGHTCGNCPAAAIVAENLYNQYKDTLVVIAVHAGFFARTNSSYPTSYTTTVGNAWDGASGFGVSAVGNPNGMVNRKDYQGGLIIKETAWPASVALAKKDTFYVRLHLTSNYDPGPRALNVTSKLKFLKAYPNDVRLTLVLMEDSIIGKQKDYSQNPDMVPNYVFMHMLRDDINGPWGAVVKTAPIAVNDSVIVQNNNFAVKENFNDKQLYLVAFVYDAVTRQVLQVEKVKIR